MLIRLFQLGIYFPGIAVVLISMDVENWTIEKALKTGAEMELESYTLYTKTAETTKYLLEKEYDDVVLAEM